jgi:quercetin dioxygenase-like cupin family protein
MNNDKTYQQSRVPAFVAAGVSLLFGAWGSLLAQADGEVVNCVPVAERASEFGCFITATDVLGELPAGPLYWHLDIYPTVAAAESAKESGGTVVESYGQVWLFTIAGPDWRPSGGERVSRVGPLPVVAASSHAVVYGEGTFAPGMVSAIHGHPGPEAWYVLEGEQCLETPEGTLIVRAGESGVVRAGLPMVLAGGGTGRRRAILLVLHDSAQPAGFPVQDWMPKGLCGG